MLAAATAACLARMPAVLTMLSDRVKPSSNGSLSSSVRFTCQLKNSTFKKKIAAESDSRNMTFTHSVTAVVNEPLLKTERYRADSMRLKLLPSEVRLYSGFAFAAAVSRADRARAAVMMSMVSSVKKEATVPQMVALKLWLSPK